MIYSIFNDIGDACKTKSADELHEYLHSIGIYFFDDIYTATDTVTSDGVSDMKRKFPGESPKSIIAYIIYAYSEDSPFLILGQNAKKEKEGICEHLGISEVWRHMLMELDCEYIRKAVVDYVEKFAGIDFKTWQFMKVQYNDITSMITNKEFFTYGKDDATKPLFDVKAYFEAENKVERLGDRIAKLEKAMRDKKGGTFKLILELQRLSKEDPKALGQKKRSLSVENAVTQS